MMMMMMIGFLLALDLYWSFAHGFLRQGAGFG
jgi:hypothetical protein